MLNRETGLCRNSAASQHQHPSRPVLTGTCLGHCSTAARFTTSHSTCSPCKPSVSCYSAAASATHPFALPDGPSISTNSTSRSTGGLGTPLNLAVRSPVGIDTTYDMLLQEEYQQSDQSADSHVCALLNVTAISAAAARLRRAAESDITSSHIPQEAHAQLDNLAHSSAGVPSAAVFLLSSQLSAAVQLFRSSTERTNAATKQVTDSLQLTVRPATANVAALGAPAQIVAVQGPAGRLHNEEDHSHLAALVQQGSSTKQKHHSDTANSDTATSASINKGPTPGKDASTSSVKQHFLHTAALAQAAFLLKAPHKQPVASLSLERVAARTSYNDSCTNSASVEHTTPGSALLPTESSGQPLLLNVHAITAAASRLQSSLQQQHTQIKPGSTAASAGLGETPLSTTSLLPGATTGGATTLVASNRATQQLDQTAGTSAMTAEPVTLLASAAVIAGLPLASSALPAATASPRSAARSPAPTETPPSLQKQQHSHLQQAQDFSSLPLQTTAAAVSQQQQQDSLESFPLSSRSGSQPHATQRLEVTQHLLMPEHSERVLPAASIFNSEVELQGKVYPHPLKLPPQRAVADCAGALVKSLRNKVLVLLQSSDSGTAYHHVKSIATARLFARNAESFDIAVMPSALYNEPAESAASTPVHSASSMQSPTGSGRSPVNTRHNKPASAYKLFVWRIPRKDHTWDELHARTVVTCLSEDVVSVTSSSQPSKVAAFLKDRVQRTGSAVMAAAGIKAVIRALDASSHLRGLLQRDGADAFVSPQWVELQAEGQTGGESRLLQFGVHLCAYHNPRSQVENSEDELVVPLA